MILLDRNIAYGRSAQTAREVGAAIVDQLGPGDLAAVVHTAHLNQSQNFTADRQRLLAAIQSRGVGMSLALGAGRAIGDCPCGLCSIDAVAHIARTLGSAGPRQKTIFFIGSGIATAFDADDGGARHPAAATASRTDGWRRGRCSPPRSKPTWWCTPSIRWASRRCRGPRVRLGLGRADKESCRTWTRYGNSPAPPAAARCSTPTPPLIASRRSSRRRSRTTCWRSTRAARRRTGGCDVSRSRSIVRASKSGRDEATILPAPCRL